MEELEIIQHKHVSGLTIFLNTVEYRTAHFHPEWELLWVLDEPLVISCEQKTQILQPGQLVLFSPNLPHEFQKQERRSTFLCLQIAPQYLPSCANRKTEGIHIAQHLSAEDYAWLKKTMLEIAQAYFCREPFYDLQCIGLSSLALRKLLQHVPNRALSAEETSGIAKRNARLLRLIQFVDENYMHKIRLSDFAKQEGLSMSYLSHFVKEALNRTFQEYVTYVRFNRACQLIAAGNKSMMAVCAESGFSDYRYFSRTFQQSYGMTPVEYSQHMHHLMQGNPQLHHSLHSQEQFYSPEQSILLLNRLNPQLHIQD